MSFLSSLRAWLATKFLNQAQLDEAYLANSVDVFDLENRIRILDQRGSSPKFGALE